MISSGISGCPMITLADGQQHTVGVMAFNANSFFLAKTNLLVFTDCRSRQVTGGVLSHDLTPAPMPVVSEHIATTAKGSTGSISVGSNRNFITSSCVNKSQGCVEPTVRESVNSKASRTSRLTPTPTCRMRCKPPTVTDGKGCVSKDRGRSTSSIVHLKPGYSLTCR
jgi:hypothetical protein